MNAQPKYLKAAVHLFRIQSVWTVYFLKIVLLVSIIRIIFRMISESIRGVEFDGYFNIVFVAGNIYMFIIGIIAITFLPYLVENGVTRKDYFIGTTLSALALSVFIPFVAVVVSLIEKGIVKLFGVSYIVTKTDEFDVEYDGNIIGDIIQSMIISPHVSLDTNWLLACFVLFLNLFIIYLLGWLIGASFYRFGSAIGLFVIAVAIFLKLLKDTLMKIPLGQTIHYWFTPLETLAPAATALGILGIICTIIVLIRMMTKRVAIKI